MMKTNSTLQESLKVLAKYGLQDENSLNLNAYLGVSFSKMTYFSKRVMSSYVRWSCCHFRDLLIIIADHLEIYNQQVFNNYSFELAKEKTSRVGQELSKAYKKAIPHELIDRVTIRLASEILAERGCKELVDFVLQILNTEQQLRVDIQSTILQVLAGKMREMKLTALETEAALEILQNYLVEEIAIILYITCKAGKKYEVSIFPYAPPEVLIKLYEGAYGDTFVEMTSGRPYKAIELVTEDLK